MVEKKSTASKNIPPVKAQTTDEQDEIMADMLRAEKKRKEFEALEPAGEWKLREYMGTD